MTVDVVVIDMVEVDLVVVDVVEVGVVEVDVVVVDVMEFVNEDYLMSNLIRFDIYYRLDFDHRS